MGKIKELSAQGVTDLHSYNVGYEACRDDLKKMITNSLSLEGLDKLPAHWVLRILLVSLNEEEEDDEATAEASGSEGEPTVSGQDN